MQKFGIPSIQVNSSSDPETHVPNLVIEIRNRITSTIGEPADAEFYDLNPAGLNK